MEKGGHESYTSPVALPVLSAQKVEKRYDFACTLSSKDYLRFARLSKSIGQNNSDTVHYLLNAHERLSRMQRGENVIYESESDDMVFSEYRMRRSTWDRYEKFFKMRYPDSANIFPHRKRFEILLSLAEKAVSGSTENGVENPKDAAISSKEQPAKRPLRKRRLRRRVLTQKKKAKKQLPERTQTPSKNTTSEETATKEYGIYGDALWNQEREGCQITLNDTPSTSQSETHQSVRYYSMGVLRPYTGPADPIARQKRPGSRLIKPPPKTSGRLITMKYGEIGHLLEGEEEDFSDNEANVQPFQNAPASSAQEIVVGITVDVKEQLAYGVKQEID